MLPWLQQKFVGEEDCVTSPNKLSVGGGFSHIFISHEDNHATRAFTLPEEKLVIMSKNN